MKKENFRLQKLLDIRIDKEEESKRTFQKLQNEKNEVEIKLNELKDSYKRHNMSKNKSTTVERKMLEQYLTNVTFSINVTTTELEKKEEEVEVARIELKKCQVDRKTVEILKDKWWQNYLKEQELIEQKSNDEFALYGFIRNLKGGEIGD